MKVRSSKEISPHGLLLYRLLLVMLAYTLCRLGFLFSNWELFQHMNFAETAYAFAGGLKFDVVAVLYINAIYIAAQLIPFPFRYQTVYQKLSDAWFLLSNGIGFLANFSDFVYYKYTLKRTTASVFDQFSNEQNKLKLLTDFIADFWALSLVFILLLWLFRYAMQKVKIAKPNHFTIRTFLLHTLLLGLSAALFVIGVRGGWRHSTRPITLSNAGDFVKSPGDMALVLNTPFSIIRTLKAAELKPVDYFDEKTLTALYQPIHLPVAEANFKPLNVVFLIIESLGKEHVGALNTDLQDGHYKGYTPFIDSLVRESFTSTATYANGRKSIDALPSIISGIPSIREPYVLSAYSGNKTTSIAQLLGEKGYETAFFHGAPNGSMGFSAYTNLAGIKRYYGKNEYAKNEDFDGIWGIWDEPFLQYTAHTLMKLPQPFFAAFFSVSSHHPFKVPAAYTGKFPKGPLPVQEPIGYTDYALKRFFETASKMPWFRQTLFVLCADHATVSHFPEYQTIQGSYSIPILFYYPGGNLKGKTDKIIQQIDIMPTVLNYLQYDQPYFAFGFDALSTEKNNFAINNNDGNYQFYQGDYLLINDGKVSSSLYNLKEDRLNKKNLIHLALPVKEQMETSLKAFIQQYNHRMIHNRLTVNP